MSNRMITRREVQTRLGITKSTLYRWMLAGEFPRPISVGPRSVRWPESEVAAWVAARPRSCGADTPAAS